MVRIVSLTRRKRDTNGGRAMNASVLPKPYELSKIAAVIFGREAIEKPIPCVKASLGLWLAAQYELSKAEKRDFPGNAREYSPIANLDTVYYERLWDTVTEKTREERENDPLAKPVRFGSSAKDSDALQWLERNADRDRDKLKTFDNFRKAWYKIFEKDADDFEKVCNVGLLRLFQAKRIALNRAADAKRKRAKRASKKIV